MDAVIDDIAIRSPLDARAALFSSLTLRNALLATLESGRKSYCIREIEEALHLALGHSSSRVQSWDARPSRMGCVL